MGRDGFSAIGIAAQGSAPMALFTALSNLKRGVRDFRHAFFYVRYQESDRRLDALQRKINGHPDNGNQHELADDEFFDEGHALGIVVLFGFGHDCTACVQTASITDIAARRCEIQACQPACGIVQAIAQTTTQTLINNMTNTLLQVDSLQTTFGSGDNLVRAVDGVSFDIAPGETFALLGESGCGKSMTALSAMRLVPEPAGRISSGAIRLHGEDLLSLPEVAMRDVRGRRIAMIFQEPMTSLNPVFNIGDQISEVILLHRNVDKNTARKEVISLLHRVGIPAPETALDRYPHELSGGQRQRVMIAMALSCDPRLLVADEPTTALDVTVQAQILDLLDDLRRENGMAVLLITHDLGVVSQYCDRVAVMYGGQVVEMAKSELLFSHPKHRYTQALLQTIPAANLPGKALPAIVGNVPPPGQRPSGCYFHPRCSAKKEVCSVQMPELTRDGHMFRCWNPAP